MSELPYFTSVRPHNSSLIRLDDKCPIVSLVPCKKRDKIYNWYTPNIKMKALYAIIRW